MNRIIALVCVVFAPSVCSADAAPSKVAFRVSISKHLERSAKECHVRAWFPQKVFTRDKNWVRLMDLMKDAGWLTQTQLSSGAWGEYQYQITEEGKKQYLAGRQCFTFGKAVVKEISSYTIPVDSPYGRMSKADYLYQFEGLPEWMKNGEFLELVEKNLTPSGPTSFSFLNALKSSHTPATSSATLVLTSEGWAVKD